MALTLGEVLAQLNANQLRAVGGTASCSTRKGGKFSGFCEHCYLPLSAELDKPVTDNGETRLKCPRCGNPSKTGLDKPEYNSCPVNTRHDIF